MKIDRRTARVNAVFHIVLSAPVGARLRCRFFLFVFGVLAINVFAQSDLDILAQRLDRGNTEQKRDALLQIRNLKSAEAARLAVSALSDKSEIVRASAAQSIVFLPPDEAALALLPLLRDKSVLVRKEAAYALGKTQNPQVVRPLVEIIQRDKIQEVKDAATVALGSIGDVSALDALTRILQRRPREEEEFFRRAAARSIGQIAQIIQIGEDETITPENFLPDPFKETTKPVYKNLAQAFPQFRAALPVLLQTLQNPRESDDARREAAFALGAIGDESAIPVLRANLNGKDYYLAEISREALLKLSKQTE
ncbi:MAG TPA: HEAT repeat domain-containing protein [Pyrinomonadaceae bacterium]|jgi:HEAT repeat protein